MTAASYRTVPERIVIALGTPACEVGSVELVPLYNGPRNRSFVLTTPPLRVQTSGRAEYREEMSWCDLANHNATPESSTRQRWIDELGRSGENRMWRAVFRTMCGCERSQADRRTLFQRCSHQLTDVYPSVVHEGTFRHFEDRSVVSVADNKHSKHFQVERVFLYDHSETCDGIGAYVAYYREAEWC